ncbi:MAG: hypothetical protein ACQEW0_09115 [Pseudomonadota bacterium]
MKKIIALALLLALYGCATPTTSSGFAKPTIWNPPVSYLESVPLGIEQDEVISQMGAPEQTAEVNGSKHWTYSLEGGVRKYTFVFDDAGVLTDVVYNDPGPYNGSRATDHR